MRRMSSLKEVAKLANVSLMTVSRVINEPQKVKQSTYQAVMRAIEQLQYVPNLSAKKIRQGEQINQSIGILSLDTATTPYSVEILLSIEETVREYGWRSFVINMFAQDNQEQAVDLLLSHRPYGIIVATTGLKPIRIPAKLQGKNVVLANCVSANYPVPSYIPDDYQGQYQATQALIQQGYQRPLCVYLPKKALATQARRQGFLHAWQQAQMSQRPIEYFMDEPENFLDIIPILQRHIKPEKSEVDCLICGNDRLAFVAYQYLLSRGIAIPQDIAVIGFDNMVGISELFLPPLTTVALPHYEMGKQAALHIIEKRPHNHCQRLFCPLIERASSMQRRR